ncbi:MAG: ABC transporter ATP-binding protein [Acidimicrobiia bacterium]|nr:ABC transporter ATP-binding protein [Acidimicrobiia bacterium]
MGQPVVRLDGVARTFDSTPPVEALKPTDLIIERGEYVAIVGPSGSGKSTLLHLLGLLDTPTSGTYWLDGIDTSTLSEAHRAGLRGARIGFVFQAFHLLAHRTTVENVAMAELYSTQSRHDRTERAVLALERVGLGHRLETFPTTLSGGERQRVALARAVVGSPSLVLADEPTGNLDSVTTEAVMSMFADLHQTGITLAVITHDPDVAKGAQRQIQIRDGTVSGGTVTAVTVGGGPVSGGPDAGHDPDVASGPTVTD